jgi:hypothetical protein
MGFSTGVRGAIGVEKVCGARLWGVRVSGTDVW